MVAHPCWFTPSVSVPTSRSRPLASPLKASLSVSSAPVPMVMLESPYTLNNEKL